MSLTEDTFSSSISLSTTAGRVPQLVLRRVWESQRWLSLRSIFWAHEARGVGWGRNPSQARLTQHSPVKHMASPSFCQHCIVCFLKRGIKRPGWRATQLGATGPSGLRYLPLSCCVTLLLFPEACLYYTGFLTFGGSLEAWSATERGFLIPYHQSQGLSLGADCCGVGAAPSDPRGFLCQRGLYCATLCSGNKKQTAPKELRK